MALDASPQVPDQRKNQLTMTPPFVMPIEWEIIPGRRAVLRFLDGMPDWKPGMIVRHKSGTFLQYLAGADVGYFQVMIVHSDSISGQFVTLKVSAYGNLAPLPERTN